MIFTYIDQTLKSIKFHTKSGILEVTKDNRLLTMIFPSRSGERCDAPELLIKGLGKEPKEGYKSRDYMAVFETEQDILNLELNMEELKKLDGFGVIVTAKGNEVDFVSRFFAPKAGINEDPVTSSAHCTLVPYWKSVLNQNKFVALQLSERGGRLYCTDLDRTISISGEAVAYLEGYINV